MSATLELVTRLSTSVAPWTVPGVTPVALVYLMTLLPLPLTAPFFAVFVWLYRRSIRVET